MSKIRKGKKVKFRFNRRNYEGKVESVFKMFGERYATVEVEDFPGHKITVTADRLT